MVTDPLRLIGGATTAWWEWSGRVLALVPGRPAVHLADLRGTDAVGRLDSSGDHALVMRRALLVVDPVTGVPVPDIEVPWASQRVPVMHQWLDPIVVGASEVVPSTADASSVSVERFWSEPFPLSERRWPGTAPGARLELAVCTEYSDRHGGSALASMVRIEPWWPSFALADTPGRLLTRLSGVRHDRWTSIAPEVRTCIESMHPEFAFAPTQLRSAPIEHIWDQLAGR
jgi:hypothetical protein